jgi:hypothetical protein
MGATDAFSAAEERFNIRVQLLQIFDAITQAPPLPIVLDPTDPKPLPPLAHRLCSLLQDGFDDLFRQVRFRIGQLGRVPAGLDCLILESFLFRIPLGSTSDLVIPPCGAQTASAILYYFLLGPRIPTTPASSSYHPQSFVAIKQTLAAASILSNLGTTIMAPSSSPDTRVWATRAFGEGAMTSPYCLQRCRK